MAQLHGVSPATVQRIWDTNGLQPHRNRTFKLSRDQQFVEKLNDVVGLYLNPPNKALVLCVDEKSQIQALQRSQPGLPMKKGRCGTMTHDYKRHGTTTLFAALNVLDGTVIGECMPRHRHQEYVKFLRKLDREFAHGLDLHLVVDNYSAHKHDEVTEWLAKHPRFDIHYTPTSSSWLNLVERWFRELTQKRLRRGNFIGVKELIAVIKEYLAQNNKQPKPFVWTATAQQIVDKVNRCKVYLAEDTNLGRPVALKILPTDVAHDRERLRRFLQEARAAAALHHPNVAHIYEIGEFNGINFIAMEYVGGQTLDAKINHHPLDVGEVIEIGIEIADALAEAHAKGITHRDIKPTNIMLTPRSEVKVLDFGLARVTTVAGAELQRAASDVSTQIKTKPGMVMGTVQYMSPEQAMGREVDHRSDIFSLGVVVYEMVTGRLPFSGETATEIIDRIAHAQPEAIARFNYSVSTELEHIIRKCLEKDKGRRYQSARELLVDLKNLQRDTTANAGMAAPSRRKRSRKSINSLAVLPLVNESADPNAEYLSDGITESIINSLAQLPQLRVMARSTVFRYKGREVDPQEVGRDLNVRAVLAGRVLRLGDRLIVKIELVDTTDGAQLWGEHYNRSPSNILAVQEEIAIKISEKLQVKLTAQEQKRVIKRYTENTEAYEAYLKGRYYWNKRTVEDFKKGIEYFQQAIEKDPSYALAYAGLADSYILLATYNFLPPTEAIPKARAAAMRALDIDSKLAEAHVSLATIEGENEWNWSAAEKEFKQALKINPNYATAHQWYGEYLAVMGRFEEALAEINRAHQLDPLSLAVNIALGDLSTTHVVTTKR